MTDWQLFTITEIRPGRGPTGDRIYFRLDRAFDGTLQQVNAYDGEPFNTWQVGDRIEVDVDNYYNRIMYNSRELGENILRGSGEGVVRKVSSAVVPASSSEVVAINSQMSSNQFQEIGNNMINRAEQSGGQYEVEFTAREEYRDNGSVSARQASWVYRKSK